MKNTVIFSKDIRNGLRKPEAQPPFLMVPQNSVYYFTSVFNPAYRLKIDISEMRYDFKNACDNYIKSCTCLHLIRTV